MPLENILDHPDLGSLVRLLAALVLSGIIGWEREYTGKAAGLRTHMLVGLGAASFLILGELLARSFNAHGADLELDPLRIVQAVVIGVGFLGAGTIFVSRGDKHVIGLTTAASIWATAGVGMLAGLGSFLIAAFATVLIVCVLHLPVLLPGSESKRKELKK
jgi:putative Mg2+ transporter-C (MgtC) family protein